MQGFCLILAIFPAPIIPRIGFYGLKYKAFSIIQDTLNKVYTLNGGEINHEDKIETKGIIKLGLIIAGALQLKKLAYKIENTETKASKIMKNKR